MDNVVWFSVNLLCLPDAIYQPFSICILYNILSSIPFNYHEMTTIVNKVYELTHSLHFQVSGLDPPHPVSSFAHFGFDDSLLSAVRKSEYTQPTPIQAQVGHHQSLSTPSGV